jgi:acyl-CoA thioesterase I
MVANSIKNIFETNRLSSIKTTMPLLLIGFLLMAMVSCNSDSTTPTAPPKDTADVPATATTTKNIVFFGNSLSAGYGLEPEEAFPAVIQRKIDSLKLPYKVVNAGVSGETSAGGNGRIDWILKQPVDIFVLELGGNDGLRGIPASETRKNLQSIISRVKTKYPAAKILLAGMQVQPNMGQAYTSEVRQMYPQLAKENNIILIPFLLEGVGGEKSLNQPDGIHPNVEGAKIVADNVWKYMRNVLE